MEENFERKIEVPSIQWFPGHMAKTRRLIASNLKLVDIVAEIIDARIPSSSRNPELDGMINGKPKVVIMNKADNADGSMTAKWLEYYKKKGVNAIACDCKSGKGVDRFVPMVKASLSDLLERRKEKGTAGQPIRIMILGIPNVGKSSFINRLASSKRAKVEDRPGVTRGKQWVALGDGVELLDMPGVLWPKFEDPEVGEKLAFTGAVKDVVLDFELLAARLAGYVGGNYPERIKERYGVDNAAELDGFDLLEAIGRKRGMLISGGEINIERAAIMFLDEYRGGKIGKITFEAPPED